MSFVTAPAQHHAAMDPAAEPLDLVFIEGFTGHTVIGIHHDELHETQPLVIDICAGTPRSAACDSDQIGDALDYSRVHARLHRLLVEHKVQLLEAFAELVANIVLQEFGARWVRVRVAKPRKFPDVQAVGVQIERTRQASSTRSTQRGNAVLQLIGAGMVPGDQH